MNNIVHLYAIYIFVKYLCVILYLKYDHPIAFIHTYDIGIASIWNFEPLVVHCCEELVVVVGEFHLLLQEFHSLDGCHIREVLA